MIYVTNSVRKCFEMYPTNFSKSRSYRCLGTSASALLRHNVSRTGLQQSCLFLAVNNGCLEYPVTGNFHFHVHLHFRPSRTIRGASVVYFKFNGVLRPGKAIWIRQKKRLQKRYFFKLTEHKYKELLLYELLQPLIGACVVVSSSPEVRKTSFWSFWAWTTTNAETILRSRVFMATIRQTVQASIA